MDERFSTDKACIVSYFSLGHLLRTKGNARRVQKDLSLLGEGVRRELKPKKKKGGLLISAHPQAFRIKTRCHPEIIPASNLSRAADQVSC